MVVHGNSTLHMHLTWEACGSAGVSGFWFVLSKWVRAVPIAPSSCIQMVRNRSGSSENVLANSWDVRWCIITSRCSTVEFTQYMALQRVVCITFNIHLLLSFVLSVEPTDVNLSPEIHFLFPVKMIVID